MCRVTWITSKSHGVMGAARSLRTHDRRADERPVIDQPIFVKIPAASPPAIHARPVDELEPYLVGEHVADGVEIAGVEAVDVSGEKRALGLRQGGNGEIIGLLRQLTQ